MRSVPLVLLAVLGLLLCGLPAGAQTLPQYATPSTGTGANSFPLNTTSSNQIQLQYLPGEFGATIPGRITHVYLQRSNTNANPSTFTNLTISMAQSSAWPTAVAWYTPVTQVYTAPSTIIPGGTAGDWFSIQLDTPFLYSPTDNLIVIVSQSGYTNGISLRNTAGNATTPRRLWGSVTGTAPTGNDGSLYHFGFDMTPASGLYAGFDADVTIGAAPLKVTFTDKTFSSDPGGVLTWAWDFDGDSKIDSTLQNPIWTYATQNKTVAYDVTLTVTDASHPQSVLTKKAYITVDPPPKADFSGTPTSGTVLPGNPPMIVQFTDLSVGANTWAWDFNGDTVVDSTLQNPAFPYVTGGRYSVTLSVTGVGGSDKITKTNYIYVADTNTLVVPTVAATTEGNSSTSYPWNTNAAAGHRIQCCYDSTHFTGITSPVLIQQLRWRANGSTTATWTGGTYDNTVIEISTAAFDYAALTTTFANNHGPDKTNVFTGTVTVDPCSAGSIPNVWYITVRLQTPFIYDPTAGGDLLIDITLPAGRTGGTSYSVDMQTTGSLASYMYSASNASSATGLFYTDRGVVMEVGYMPATGLYPEFDADVTAGSGPLKVTFTDKTYTSDPGGVTTWAWDFDGDSKIDSTLQNPIWTYPSIAATATYDVTLTVTDAANPGGKFLTKKAYITVDPPPVADFSATPTSGAVKPGGAPLMVQFTDLSIGANTWAWDFDGDNKVDSTLQNPMFPYTVGGLYSVTLSVTGVGGNDKLTKTNYIKVTDTPELSTIFLGGNGLSGSAGCFFDVDVTNPGGIWITSFDLNCYTASVPFDVEIYITPTTYVGQERTPAAWTLVGSGSGVSNTRDTATPVETGDIFLPMGKYGMYVYNKGAGHSYTNLVTTPPNNFYSNADLALTLGASASGLFTGSPIAGRIWNGTIYYITPGWPKFGPYGAGCAGSNGVPMLAPAMGSIPKIGTTYTINLSNMPVAGGSALALLGISKTMLGGVLPLPFNMAPLGAPGCWILTDIIIFAGVTNVGGLGSLALPIPNDPVLIGGYLTGQALVADPTANTYGWTVTNGGEMHIGN